MQYSTLFQTNEREKKEKAVETHVTQLLFLNSKVLGFSIIFKVLIDEMKKIQI